MASKSKSHQQSNGGASNGAEGLPEGFLSVVAERVRTFVKPQPGLTVRGVLLGRFPRKGEDGGFFYQVQLTAPLPHGGVSIPDPDDDKKWIEGSAETGAIVSIDERADMSGWAIYADRPGEVEAFVRFNEKVPIGAGKTMWRVACGIREIPGSEQKKYAAERAALAG